MKLYLNAIAVLSMASSCANKKDSKTLEPSEPVTANPKVTAEVEMFDACVLQADKAKLDHKVFCSQNREYACLFDTCKVPVNGACPDYFIKSKISIKPRNYECLEYVQAVEL